MATHTPEIKQMGTPQPNTLVWKDEGPGGPIWIVDRPVVGRLGGAIWYTAEQAEALARVLGMDFKQV